MNMKKALALVVTAIMMMPCMLAFAKTEDVAMPGAEDIKTGFVDTAGTPYENIADHLNETKIMTGYGDNTFRPYVKITRAEFAVTALRLISMDHIAKVMKPESIYSDVNTSHWAVREIKLAEDEGIINGFEDKTFRPEGIVTYNQAVAMLVCALGYGDDAIKKGGWSTGYKMVAYETGLLNGIDDLYDREITRADAAMLLKNALGVKMSDGKTPESLLGEKYFYVAPNGADTNPGTEDKPWKTLNKAAQTAIAGTTVIFEDGTYQETRVTTVTNSGEEGAPITFKARNKHKAIIQYPQNYSTQTKFQISTRHYINVRDFLFTQIQGTATSTSDIYLRCSSRTTNCELTGNRFENVFEEGIKCVSAENILIEDNEFISITHEGMDIFNCKNIVVKDNYLYNCSRVGIMMKGNTRNALIYNNYIEMDGITPSNRGSAAITLGGSSNSYDPFDIGYGTGYEAYYLIAYNNVIVAKNCPEDFPTGLTFLSSKGCMAFNNIIIGTQYGIKTSMTAAAEKGWEWDPPVLSPFMKNNIIANTQMGIFFENQPIGDVVCENNLFYNVKQGTEMGGIIANPEFVDLYSDWTLKDGSPAIDAGGDIPSEIVGYGGEIIKIDMIDYNGNPREGKWDMGIYSVGE